MNLEAENRELEARLAAMEQLLAEKQRASLGQATQLEALVTELQNQKTLLEATLNNLVDGVALANQEGVLVRFNPAAERILGLGTVDAPQGDWTHVYGLYRPDGLTLFPPDELPLARALRGETITGEEMFSRSTQRSEGAFLVVSASPVLAEDGRRMGAVAVFRDIGDRKRWERAMEVQIASEREKNDLLERMQTAVQELSTPILELWDDVLALPVIGIIDSRRSAEMTEQLLEEVVRKQARFVIIDITGVELVDTATADRFIKLVSAVEYLGATCMLTGTRSAVAQTLAALGVDLGSLITLRTLKDGLRECVRLRGGGARRSNPRRLIERAGRP
ncbi:MAG: STAS domain-containing protein [Byssovorax sp.]